MSPLKIVAIVLIVAGILAREFRNIRRAYESLGLDFVAGRRDTIWHSGVFQAGNANASTEAPSEPAATSRGMSSGLYWRSAG